VLRGVDPAVQQEMMVLRAELLLLQGRTPEAVSAAGRIRHTDHEYAQCALLRLQARLAFAQGDAATGTTLVDAFIARYQSQHDHRTCVEDARKMMDGQR
jgi:hypothetical protein